MDRSLAKTTKTRRKKISIHKFQKLFQGRSIIAHVVNRIYSSLGLKCLWMEQGILSDGTKHISQ